MPIELWTGQPGNGKTALMVERILEEAKKAERPLFYAGIKRLQPGLATLIRDIREWNAVKPGEVCTCDQYEGEVDDDGEPIVSKCTAHVVPAGSLIFVDEAWKWFGHLQDATRQATPPHALKLAEHRHRGIDFCWTAQQPIQLYPFVRGLIGTHHHVVRRFGTQMIDVYSWGELNEDVKSLPRREAALRKTRFIPKETFGVYQSSEEHTIKGKIPLRVLALPAVVIGAGFCAWLAFQTLRPSAQAQALTEGVGAAIAAPAATPPPGGTLVGQGEQPAVKYATLTDYARAHLPRFGSMPWTAPVYDHRPVTADPQLFCLSSYPGENAKGEWKDLSCTCLTEQGTRYEISQAECRTIARYGTPYNPYRERRMDQGMPPPAPEPAGFAPEPSGTMRLVRGDPAVVVGAGNAL